MVMVVTVLLVLVWWWKDQEPFFHCIIRIILYNRGCEWSYDDIISILVGAAILHYRRELKKRRQQ
jgi:hypothetical protein